MTTTATLESPAVEVVPGDAAVCRLEIRNAGAIVESYDIEVLGAAAQWSVAEPPTVSVYPGTEAYVTLRFSPPRTSLIPAGDVPFAVRVTPTEQPDQQVVPEGTLRILPVWDSTAEISPRTSQARRWARHEVAVDNRGNTPIVVAVAGTDPDGRLTIAARPKTLSVAPGQAAFARVTVRSRKLLWRGQPQTHPFQVIVASENHPPVALDAATVQTPLVPRSAIRALAALLILLLIGAGLWFTLLKPAVKSAAKEAVDKPISALQTQNTAIQEQIKDLQEGEGGGGGGAKPPPSPTPTPTAPVPPGGIPAGSTSFNQPIQLAASTSATATKGYTPTGKTFVLTDMYLQNPQGDEGRLELVVDGSVYFTWSLANFRDLDYHAVSPIEVAPGKNVTLRTTCLKPGTPLPGSASGQCRVYVLLSGYQKPVTTP